MRCKNWVVITGFLCGNFLFSFLLSSYSSLQVHSWGFISSPFSIPWSKRNKTEPLLVLFLWIKVRFGKPLRALQRVRPHAVGVQGQPGWLKVRTVIVPQHCMVCGCDLIVADLDTRFSPLLNKQPGSLTPACTT